jgi:hypothetical protein
MEAQSDCHITSKIGNNIQGREAQNAATGSKNFQLIPSLISMDQTVNLKFRGG